MLNIALPKGRLGDQVYDILASIGYDCPGYYEQNRKLVFESPEKGVRYLLVKPSDVAIYVEHHAADVGIVGKDILLETGADVYELLDLKIGKCRMAVAAPEDYVEDTDRTLRVATKYVNITKDHYGRKNRDIEIIKLNGSIELAPILGLTDVIVDIVETGNTIRENHLKITEEFRDISARFIANKTSFKFENEIISHMLKKLGEQIK
ncbi:MAG: ATP phosphoribosyltransferase [Bacillota bacterium]|nr:ATP phosphoribosyltransferase [Bacillota bacterium]